MNEIVSSNSWMASCNLGLSLRDIIAMKFVWDMQIDNFQSERVHSKQDLSVCYLVVEESLLTHYF